MNTETMITELKSVSEKHKNDFVPTFQTNISSMCRDIIPKLEQLAEYEKIGTVERFQQLSEQFKHHVTDETSCPERHCNKCDKYRKENEKYHAIGTVDECRQAVERQRAIKPTFEMNFWDCESKFSCECGKKIVVRHDRGVMDNHDGPNYCSNCGCKFDWSDNE